MIAPGPYRCGCNAAFGQSCRECDGTNAEEREMDRLPPARRRELLRENLRRRTEVDHHPST